MSDQHLMTKGVKDQAQYHSLLPIMFANVFLLGVITIRAIFYHFVVWG